MAISRKELEALIDSSANGLEVAKILLKKQPACRDGLLHTVLEDVAVKVQKIALDFCAYEN